MLNCKTFEFTEDRGKMLNFTCLGLKTVWQQEESLVRQSFDLHEISILWCILTLEHIN